MHGDSYQIILYERLKKMRRIATEDKFKYDGREEINAVSAFRRLLNFSSSLRSRSMKNSGRQHDQRSEESKKAIHC
jgi:hypothetical protein